MKQALLQQIFWDVDQTQLENLGADQVIARALSHGTLPVLQNIFADYGKGHVQQVFLAMKPTSFDARRYSYFKQLFI
jgi:hypothetical protein